jgi:hypothetical protein
MELAEHMKRVIKEFLALRIDTMAFLGEMDSQMHPVQSFFDTGPLARAVFILELTLAPGS